MTDKLITNIINKKLTEAEASFKENMSDISLRKLHEVRKMVAAHLSEQRMLPSGRVMTQTVAGPEVTNQSVIKQRRGVVEEDKDDSPFKGGDSEKVSNPDAKQENQAKKLAIKAMKKMKEKENIKEEEYLDEVSKEKAARYIKAASLDAIDRAAWGGHEAPPSRSGPYGHKFPHKKVSNRERGIALATDKLTGKAKVPAKEKSDK